MECSPYRLEKSAGAGTWDSECFGLLVFCHAGKSPHGFTHDFRSNAGDLRMKAAGLFDDIGFWRVGDG